jgi:hypothetical protein
VDGKVINSANLSLILRDWSQSLRMRLDGAQEHTFGMIIRKKAVYVVLGYNAKEQRNGYGVSQGVTQGELASIR